MKRYPSRLIAPAIIMLALITVLIHSSLVEVFRTAPDLLNLAYLAITLVSIVIYWHLAPYLVHTFQRIIPTTAEKPAVPDAATLESFPAENVVSVDVSGHARLSQLTAREREVLELIGGGYSNRDIAKILVISEHTVNDYTKKIYRKLDVHSRHAAAQIINRLN